MTILYRIYQLFVAIPLIVLATVLTALVTIVGCFIGNGHFWGYYPGKCWSWFIIRILFLPIKVEGRENLQPGQSYVFAANHQGAFDIFMIYGFLGRNFKWMMKQSLRKIPLVGKACEQRLKLTIHAPIMPIGQGTDNTKFLEEQSYQVIMGSLVPEYQGFEANPDQ